MSIGQTEVAAGALKPGSYLISAVLAPVSSSFESVLIHANPWPPFTFSGCQRSMSTWSSVRLVLLGMVFPLLRFPDALSAFHNCQGDEVLTHPLFSDPTRPSC